MYNMYNILISIRCSTLVQRYPGYFIAYNAFAHTRGSTFAKFMEVYGWGT